ncbi:MAG: MerR family transcriptional regulator [Blautia sp.]|nr:MerR family transcriptional regulator [Blautia sp.]MCM1199719.1 MerR family transcriptional regulator [Bacteroides fragilis]
MMTVKEISKLTGISARTLHYYDEIGLFTPTEKSEAGYRLYDDKALETLQQILFFREFDIPLKEIKAVMENPALDRNQILQMQREMLAAKKERIERLIAEIDDIMKGDGKMAFEIFNKSEIEDMYHAMAGNMSDAQKEIFIEQYGSMEEWKKSFLKKASTMEVQKNFEKVVEWYGGKEAAMNASRHPGNADIQPAYQNRITAVLQKLADNRGKDVDSFEVRSLVGEYDFVIKQMFQLPDASKMVLELAMAYQENEKMQAVQDSIYGEGATAYIKKALEAFYKR